MKSSKIIAVVIAVVALLWIGSSLMGSGEAPSEPVETPQAQQKAEDKIQSVRIREITAESYIDDVIITGRSRASQRVELKAETSGQVKTLLKEEGDAVKKGDTLAELEVRDRQARQTEAQQRVNQRTIEYEAARKLAEKGFNSKVRLAQSLAELEDAKALLSDAKVNLQKTEITAPFDGIIAVQDVEIGDYLAIGDPVFTIVNLNPIEFVGFVSERRVQDLEMGKAAKVEFLNGEVIDTKVTYIAPAADNQTRTFRVIVTADNADLNIKEGLTAKIRIPVADRQAHKISPAILSLNDEGQIGVKIVNDQDVVEFVPVSILADKPEAMWIAGPPPVARIITVGQDFVAAGQKVKAVESDSDGLL